MKGDFSRLTFDPAKHYSGVLMQQGRVQTDADWNEQLAIAQYHRETALLDVIGPCGAPANLAGFRVSVKDGKSLVIGPGRYYVDGLLCENENEALLSEPVDVTKALGQSRLAIVYLDVWEQHVTALDDDRIREVALGGPDTATRVKTSWQVRLLPVEGPVDRLIRERTRLQLELDRLPPSRTSDISRRILEARIGEINGAIAAAAGLPPPTCGTAFPEWDALVAPSTGSLRARTRPPLPEKNACKLPPTAGYQRLENQLYRVEIHTGGVPGNAPGNATFKWSRENGSVLTTVTAIQDKDIGVGDLGRDESLGFAPGQWVELLDESQEATGLPGKLLQIASVDGAKRTVTVTQSPGVSLPPLPDSPPSTPGPPRPKFWLRRWDQTGSGATTDGVAIKDGSGFIPLEGGIEVAFSQGTYKTGDYWLIPARTATTDIEWPPYQPGADPLAQPPLGVKHHYCRLALLSLGADGKMLAVQDCRRTFVPFTERAPAIHVLGTNWLNDDEMTTTNLIKDGLQVTLDAIPGSLTVPEAGVIVVLERIERDDKLPLMAGMTVLRGNVTLGPNGMLWRPVATLDQLENLFGGVSAMRVRVTLKGHVIWSEVAGLRTYLDGQAFGQPDLRADKKTPRTALDFPSGDDTRASDFESWFELTVPLRVKAVTLKVAQTSVGNAVDGVVTLNRPAPAGTKVSLQSSNPATASVLPPVVEVPAGKDSASFKVNPLKPDSVTITATLGDSQQAAALKVT
jgi:Family of unknown function (DUF6519)